MRRCALSTVKNVTVVSEMISSRMVARCQWAASNSAAARCDARLAFSAQLDQLAQLQGRFRGIEAAILTAPQRVIELEGQVGIGDSAGLNAPARGNAYLALGSRQPGVHSQRALQGQGERERTEGLRKRSGVRQ